MRRRRSLRLRGFDYSQAGAFFITVCVKNKECSLGVIRDGKVVLSPVGEIVYRVWTRMQDRFKGVVLDRFVIMPNHLHCLINLADAEAETGRPPTLGGLIRGLKAASARRIRTIVDPSFAWQRNYYEHVIRNEQDLARVREYIENNPLRWDLDSENPHRREVRRSAGS